MRTSFCINISLDLILRAPNGSLVVGISSTSFNKLNLSWTNEGTGTTFQSTSNYFSVSENGGLGMKNGFNSSTVNPVLLLNPLN